MTVPDRIATQSLKDQVAIVTGAGRSPGRVASIGEAIARVLAARGAIAAVVDLDAQAAERTVDAIISEGGEAIAVVADLSIEAGCASATQNVLQRCGRLDILVNNVGMGKGGVITEVTEADFDLVVAVNVKSAMFMAKSALPHMSESGAIVNVSTTAVRYPTTGFTYSASKAAMEALTDHIALQFGPAGVRCNTVRPGEVWTAMVDRNCPTEEAAEKLRADRASRSTLPYGGDAWDIAHLVSFLSGPESRWISGQTISVDGGAQLIRPNPNWKSSNAYWKARRT